MDRQLHDVFTVSEYNFKDREVRKYYLQIF